MPHKLADVDLSLKVADKKEYARRLELAQLQLLLLQRNLHRDQRRAIMAFEGWDAAGKGGAIKRFTERLDPRGFHVHPIGAPDATEKSYLYLHRFWLLHPRPGSFAIFDRTWYGRVLVERVERLASKAEWKRAYGEINAYEEMLVDAGVPVLKFFLHISKAEQLRRFEERQHDVFKSWKITDEDWRNREKWDQYEEAIEDMLKKTDTKKVPWHVVSAEHKWHGRLEVLETSVAELAAFFDLDVTLPKGWRREEQD